MLYRRRGRQEQWRKIWGKIAIFCYFSPFWEEEEERERGKLLPGIVYVHKSLLLLLLLFSIFIVIDTRILLAFLVNQSANSGDLAKDSKAAFVDSVPSSSASSALKNLPRELLARPTGGVRFLFFSSE